MRQIPEEFGEITNHWRVFFFDLDGKAFANATERL